jgi:hypothetical protein
MATTLSFSSYPILISPTFNPTSKFGNFCHSVELSIKDPKLGVLGISFVKTRDEIKSEDEKCTRLKELEGTKLVFSPKLVLTGVSTPVLNFSSLHLQCHSNSSFNQLLSKYNLAKSCELISNFINSTQFHSLYHYIQTEDATGVTGSNQGPKTG